MQNGADIFKNQSETIFPHITVTEAELSVEALKFGRHLIEKGPRNDSNTDASLPIRPDKHLEPIERDGEGKGRTADDKRDTSNIMDEYTFSEDDPFCLIDNSGFFDNPLTDTSAQGLPNTNGNQYDSPKKKRGRPRKNKGNSKAENVTKKKDQETEEANPDPEVDVDLFTFVPGKTSHPIQLSAVSSADSEDNNSPVSFEIEAFASEQNNDNLDEMPISDIKKLLKSKLSRNAAIESPKSKKRKVNAEIEPQGKARKLPPLPVEDSSSMQKTQDMIDFVESAKRAISGDMSMDASIVGPDGSDIVDNLNEQFFPSPLPAGEVPRPGEKIKRKYTKRSPKKVQNLAEVSASSDQWETILTTNANDSPISAIDPLPKIAKAKKYKKKKKQDKEELRLLAFKARLAKAKKREAKLAAAAGKGILSHNNVHEPSPSLSETVSLTETVTMSETTEIYEPGVPIVGEKVVNHINESQQFAQNKKIVGVKISKLGKKRRKKMKWNKTKKHSPNVLQRMENHRRAIEEFTRLQEEGGFIPVLEPEFGQNLEEEVLPPEPQNGLEPIPCEGEGHLETLSTLPSSSVNPPAPQLPVISIVVPKKRPYVKSGKYTKIMKHARKYMTNIEKYNIDKLENPLVIPKGGKKVFDPKGKKNYEGQVEVDDSPVLPNMDTVVTSSHTAGNNSAIDPHIGEKSSELPAYSGKIKNKLLMPRDADYFEKDTGSVNMKNIITGKRKVEPKKFNVSPRHGLYSKASRELRDPKVSRNLNKSLDSVVGHAEPSESVVNPASVYDMDTDPYIVGSPDQASTPLFNHERPIPRLSRDRSLPRLSRDQSLPRLSRDSSLPRVSQDRSLPRLSQEKSLPGSNQEKHLPRLSQERNLPLLNKERNMDKTSHRIHQQQNQERIQHVQDKIREHRQSGDRFLSKDNLRSPNHHRRHHPYKHGLQERRRYYKSPRSSSSQANQYSYTDDTDPVLNSTERTDGRSFSERTNGRSFSDESPSKGIIGNTVGQVLSQLFGDEIPRLAPGSGYVINVKLDVERKASTSSNQNPADKNVSANEELDTSEERRRLSTHSASSRGEKSTHVSSTVNSSRKPQSNEPQPSTSHTPDETQPRETTRPRISDVDLCAMLEERIATRKGLRVDVRDNLLDNIKHVERVLKESSS